MNSSLPEFYTTRHFIGVLPRRTESNDIAGLCASLRSGSKIIVVHVHILV
jgi:hypothetical protein